jgi:hypothetical protein
MCSSIRFRGISFDFERSVCFVGLNLNEPGRIPLFFFFFWPLKRRIAAEAATFNEHNCSIQVLYCILMGIVLESRTAYSFGWWLTAGADLF